MQNKPLFMRKWTNEVIKVCLTDIKISEFVREHYLPLFQTRISKLFTEYFPERIEADTLLLKIINGNRRKPQEILTEFQPLYRRVIGVRGKVMLFRHQFIDKNAINVDTLRV